MVYEWYLNRYTHTHTHTHTHNKYLWKVWQQKNLTDLLGQSSLRLMNSQYPQHLLASSPVRKPSEERRQKDSCYLGIATHTNQTGRRNLSISLPVPLSEDSCVVCHLKPADEGGTHPRENSNACLDRAVSSETVLLLQWLKNFDSFGNSLSLMMYECMTHFVAFSTSMLGTY